MYCILLTTFSKARKEPLPRLDCFRYWIHFWAVSTVSTRTWSNEPHPVDIATSYFSSIAPKSPKRPKMPGNVPLRFCSIRLSKTRPRLLLAEKVDLLCSSRIRIFLSSSLFCESSFVIYDTVTKNINVFKLKRNKKIIIKVVPFVTQPVCQKETLPN